MHFGELFGFFLVAIYLAVVVFLIVLFHRLVKAQEQTSRHLLEIVRDLKKLIDSKKE